MGLGFDCPVVIVGGTNGKGSTCAMLEAIAMQAGYRVGVYTSPHLVHFEERCRVQGQAVSAEALLPHFAAVEAARAGQSLTYFEFTTLAILPRLLAVCHEGGFRKLRELVVACLRILLAVGKGLHPQKEVLVVPLLDLERLPLARDRFHG
jgi:hypothetical protein